MLGLGDTLEAFFGDRRSNRKDRPQEPVRPEDRISYPAEPEWVDTGDAGMGSPSEYLDKSGSDGAHVTGLDAGVRRTVAERLGFLDEHHPGGAIEDDSTPEHGAWQEESLKAAMAPFLADTLAFLKSAALQQPKPPSLPSNTLRETKSVGAHMGKTTDKHLNPPGPSIRAHVPGRRAVSMMEGAAPNIMKTVMPTPAQNQGR